MSSTTAHVTRTLEEQEEEREESVVVEENKGKTEGCDTWNIGRVRVSRSLIVYFLQVLVIYIVVITSIYNLTRGYCNQSDQKLWVATLSSAIGYLLPSPTLTHRELSR